MAAVMPAKKLTATGIIISWDPRGYAFARTSDGTAFYLGGPELRRAGVRRLEIGDRVLFEKRLATTGRAPWGANIRVLPEVTT
jgi:hypothetical protein